MPYPLIFGFGDNQPTLVNTAVGTGMMRQPEFIALRADGQLRQGNMVVRAPHVLFGR